VLDKCYNVGLDGADGCWSRLLTASPPTSSLWLQLSFFHHPPIGLQHAWKHLPATLLVVLVQSFRTPPSSHVPAASKDAFRQAVRALPALKWASRRT
jgi:hypothetical protein